MCHEEIRRRCRADLTDRDPVAHRDCKRSPRVPVELLVREQRLLTIQGKRAFLFAAQDLAFAGQPACTRESAALPQDRSRDKAISLAAVSAVGLINGAADVRKSATAVKAKQRR